MIKLSLILTDFVNLKRLIDQQVAGAQQKGIENQPLWTMVKPSAGKLDRIIIEPSELVCLYEFRAFDTVTAIIEATMQHTTVVDSFNTYSELRMRLKDYMPSHSVEGAVVISALTSKQSLEVTPRLLELESTIGEINRMLPGFVQTTTDLVQSLGPLGKKIFADPKFPTISNKPI